MRVFLILRLRVTSSMMSPPYLMFFLMVQRGSISSPLSARFFRRLICVAIFEAIKRIARPIARLSSMPISLKSFEFSDSRGL